MKKLRLILIALLVLSVTCAVAFGCGETPPEDVTPTTYTVTVTGGTADKTAAAEGATITLTQGTAPDGSEFLRWTVNGEAISGNTFKMPAKNVTVVAEFQKIDYTVTVTGGTADKTTAQLGDTVTLTPSEAAAGQRFSHWTVNGSKIEGNTFVMTAANAAVVAVFVNINYTVTVTGGTADKTTAQLGETVTLTPSEAAAGQRFSHWTVNGSKIEGNTFVMTAENATVVAVYENVYSVTVTGGTANKAVAAEGEEVILTADGASAGYEFSHFTLNGTRLDSNYFNMPASNAVVEAVFVKINYTVTVTGGTADKTTAQLGDTVTLTATEATETKAFSHWTVNGSKIDGNSFVMTASNADVVAVYVDLVQKIATPDNGSNKLFYPEGATFPCAVAIDRAGNSMFTEATDHVLLYVYDDANADTADSLGTLRLTANSLSESGSGAVLSTSDGTLTMNIKGQPSNYYFDAMDWNQFFGLLKHELGYRFGEGRTYYFAAQIVAKDTAVSVNGFEVTYEDSGISVIGAQGIAKDASKPSGMYTVTVSGGFINGNLTSLISGYGNTVTLTAEAKEGYLFNGWYATDGEGEKTGDAISYETELTYTVTGDADLLADYVATGDVERTKLATPNNTASELISRAANGAIELDRADGKTNTMFTAATASVVYYIYTSPDAEQGAYIGQFRMRVIPGADPVNGTAFIGWVETMDGEVSLKIVRGSAGDYYIDGSNASEFFGLLKTILGYKYGEGITYYYAAQAIAAEGTIYADSDISVIGSTGMAQDASKPSDYFTVTVLDGTIDGSQTTVEAGYGVKLTLTAEMPEGYDTFLGWKVVTYEDGNEILGSAVSFDLTYTLTVSSSVTLRPVFGNSSEIQAEKLEAPDNSSNQMIVFNGSTIEYDRQKEADGSNKTAFAAGVSYVVYHIYTSDADDAAPVASFKLMVDGEKGYFLADDGTRLDLLGDPGNFYTLDGNAHNFIKSVIGNYDTSVAYYYACQAVSSDKTLYEDSDIGAKGQGWVNI